MVRNGCFIAVIYLLFPSLSSFPSDKFGRVEQAHRRSHIVNDVSVQQVCILLKFNYLIAFK